MFDGVLMFVALVWMNWFHLSEIGLLGRGERPPKHGLELIYMKRSPEKNYESFDNP